MNSRKLRLKGTPLLREHSQQESRVLCGVTGPTPATVRVPDREMLDPLIPARIGLHAHALVNEPFQSVCEQLEGLTNVIVVS